MCCSADWKREQIVDHKFDFVDIKEYHTQSWVTRFRFGLVYVFLLKSVLVYISDLYTAIALLASNHWSGSLLQASEGKSAIEVPFTIGKWIFTGCIILSFLLLAWEARKARLIIKSRDISYAYTNLMANDYYSMKSYDHFCFFSQINNSKKKKDEFAFFVFFTFKGWKRLLLADAPRQVINGITLFSFAKAYDFTTTVSVYYTDTDGSISWARAGIIVTMLFTVAVWAVSALLLLIAAFMYIPLLCYIQGNLKEYCCHKIDKRIAELMKRKTRKRLAREAALAKKEAAGDYSHLKDKKGRFKDGLAPLPQPTLPTVNLADDDLYDTKSEMGSNFGLSKPAYPPSIAGSGYDRQQGDPYWAAQQIPYGRHDNNPYQVYGRNHEDNYSVKSFDPLINPSLSSIPLTKAPSYHSQPTGSRDGYDYNNPPPPHPLHQQVGAVVDYDSHGYPDDYKYPYESYPDDYYEHPPAQPYPQQHHDADYFPPMPPIEQYDAPSRQNLYERTQQQQTRPESETELNYWRNTQMSTATRPTERGRDSVAASAAFDLENYYAESVAPRGRDREDSNQSGGRAETMMWNGDDHWREQPPPPHARR